MPAVVTGPTLHVALSAFMLLLAALQPMQGYAAGTADAGDLIALCRPRAGAVGMAPPCICSVEQVEQPLTPDEFLRHMRDLRAAAAASAAELRAAAGQARDACGRKDPFAVSAGTRNAKPAGADPSVGSHSGSR